MKEIKNIIVRFFCIIMLCEKQIKSLLKYLYITLTLLNKDANVIRSPQSLLGCTAVVILLIYIAVKPKQPLISNITDSKTYRSLS